MTTVGFVTEAKPAGTFPNSSRTSVTTYFFWHDRFPTDCATAKSITTGTYNARLNYRVTYKTNYKRRW